MNYFNHIQTLKAHVALNVSNVTASIEFYQKMFDLEPCKVRPGYAKFDVMTPPLNLTLNQNAAVVERGTLSHLGIQVAATADVLKIRELWQEKGLLTRDEMETNCCYARQDKTWITDPDGNEWEVFAILEDNLPALETTQTANACCAPALSQIGR